MEFIKDFFKDHSKALAAGLPPLKSEENTVPLLFSITVASIVMVISLYLLFVLLFTLYL